MIKISLFLILFLAVIVVPVFADDDDERKEFGEREDDEREDDEREDDEREDDDERLRLGSGMSEMVLYVTIAAIIGTIGYTGFKIISAKRPKLVKK